MFLSFSFFFFSVLFRFFSGFACWEPPTKRTQRTPFRETPGEDHPRWQGTGGVEALHRLGAQRGEDLDGLLMFIEWFIGWFIGWYCLLGGLWVVYCLLVLFIGLMVH